jgi:hypothetical protein
VPCFSVCGKTLGLNNKGFIARPAHLREDGVRVVLKFCALPAPSRSTRPARVFEELHLQHQQHMSDAGVAGVVTRKPLDRSGMIIPQSERRVQWRSCVST